MKSLEQRQSFPETRISQYLQPDDIKVGLDRVFVKEHGYFIGWIIGYYEQLPDTEKDKIDVTSRYFHLPTDATLAVLDYRARHPEVIQARVFLNETYPPMSQVVSQEREKAELIIQDASAKIDSLFEE